MKLVVCELPVPWRDYKQAAVGLAVWASEGRSPRPGGPSVVSRPRGPEPRHSRQHHVLLVWSFCFW